MNAFAIDMVTRCDADARRSPPWTLVLVVASAVVLFASGCQKQPTTVSGSVTLDGQPLNIRDGMRGTVVFQPAKGGPILNGNIDRQGDYQLAAGSSVRVAPGEYMVSVSAVEIIPPSDDNPLPSSRRITPPKFASADQSGLHVEVVPGSNNIDLKLTSDKDSPTESTGEQIAKPVDGSGEQQVEKFEDTAQ